MADSALFRAFGLNKILGAVAITLVVLVYSSLSGLWDAYATSVVQVGFITVALIMALISVLSGGGLDTINNAIASGAVPSDFWKLDNIGIQAILITVVPVCAATLCDQQTVQRIISAKSAKVSMTAHILSTVMCIILAFLPVIVGMYGAAKYSVTDSSVFFVVAMEKLPALVSAIAIAAIMSTIDGALIAFSTVALKNIYKGLINPEASEKAMKKGDTIVSVVVMALSLILSLQFDNIISLLSSTYAFLSACCLVPFVGGLFWKRGTAKGAIASSIVGLIVVALTLTKAITLPLQDLSPIAISFVVYVAVSLADPSAKEQAAA